MIAGLITFLFAIVAIVLLFVFGILSVVLKLAFKVTGFGIRMIVRPIISLILILLILFAFIL